MPQENTRTENALLSSGLPSMLVGLLGDHLSRFRGPRPVHRPSTPAANAVRLLEEPLDHKDHSPNVEAQRSCHHRAYLAANAGAYRRRPLATKTIPRTLKARAAGTTARRPNDEGRGGRCLCLLVWLLTTLTAYLSRRRIPRISKLYEVGCPQRDSNPRSRLEGPTS